MRYPGNWLGKKVLLTHARSATPELIAGSASFHLASDSDQKICTLILSPLRFSASATHHLCCLPNQEFSGTTFAILSLCCPSAGNDSAAASAAIQMCMLMRCMILLLWVITSGNHKRVTALS